MRIQITPTNASQSSWGYKNASLIDQALVSYTDQATVDVRYNLEHMYPGLIPATTTLTVDDQDIAGSSTFDAAENTLVFQLDAGKTATLSLEYDNLAVFTHELEVKSVRSE